MEPISFDEKEHKYSLDGIEYISVTTFINTILFEKFNEIEVSEIIEKQEKDKNHKYYGLNSLQIRELWNKIRDNGINVHSIIEKFYKNETLTLEETEKKEFKQFMKFHQEKIISNNIEPYKSEFRIYDKELRIAGTIDMIYKLNKDEYIIYDWKTSEKITRSNPYKSGIVQSITNNCADCNFCHFSIQLMLYREILQRNYKMNITKMFIVLFNQNNNNYIIEEIKPFQNLIDKIINFRKNNT
jgi:DNA-binding transcriptional MerR regulator